ncbi:ICE-like protease (caspase) p20 domain containing protein [Ceratobasidium theobromae]|uniref:ICE-like protease (Caspase) p20 domain containing protein n=1 Tax=Ceratobasidium theobromae TaxID=1582974 RepID=A0A5N5QAR2_9AGAM|nr:ICE-like protease (caspase) p20 domain containing protein [Ceratobasidium theobromae]
MATASPSLVARGLVPRQVIPHNGDVMAYIKEAIEEGDRLPNPPTIGSPDRPRVIRRALIIAPQYEETGKLPRYPGLPSTATDVKLIHEMLTRSGYEARNIRILCDVCDGFFGLADPTRENILSSLEWLVRDTYPEDYRFLHFSGHGDRILSDSKRGKEARIVKTNPETSVPGDYELDDNHVEPGRVEEQTIAVKERVYYNEGSGNQEATKNPIMHTRYTIELNSYLSKLPRHSTITCIMDVSQIMTKLSAHHTDADWVSKCCASGRILNLSGKLRGNGFRGKASTTIFSQLSELYGGEVLSNDQETNAVITSNVDTIVSALGNIISRIVGSSTESITMLENIPQRERAMDGVQAQIFAWSGCHQRQSAWDCTSSGRETGIFTHAFTQAYGNLTQANEPSNRFSYEELFEEVSHIVSTAKKPVPQFVQVSM